MRKVRYALETWPLRSPFTITGHTVREMELLYVEIEQDGACGKGEAAGIYYLGETGGSMLAQLSEVKRAVERGIERVDLRRKMPRGGARNALDCALWDFEAKTGGSSVWASAGIAPNPLHTVNTIGIDSPEGMAEQAAAFANHKLKVKLDSNGPLERVQAIREARPDAELIVDVNQGWSFGQLKQLAPELAVLGVSMIEQPLPRGLDAELEGYASPVKLCADESCLDTTELSAAARRYQMINIKLDKTGGLTEALDLARQATSAGLELMVGNMIGTSLAMAPACLVAQFCTFVDIDGPTFLTRDRPGALEYQAGQVSVPGPILWG